VTRITFCILDPFNSIQCKRHRRPVFTSAAACLRFAAAWPVDREAVDAKSTCDSASLPHNSNPRRNSYGVRRLRADRGDGCSPAFSSQLDSVARISAILRFRRPLIERHATARHSARDWVARHQTSPGPRVAAWARHEAACGLCQSENPLHDFEAIPIAQS
jgi:hypothetical protein